LTYKRRRRKRILIYFLIGIKVSVEKKTAQISFTHHHIASGPVPSERSASRSARDFGTPSLNLRTISAVLTFAIILLLQINYYTTCAFLNFKRLKIGGVLEPGERKEEKRRGDPSDNHQKRAHG
jgi:hypothetical protein